MGAVGSEKLSQSGDSVVIFHRRMKYSGMRVKTSFTNLLDIDLLPVDSCEF